MLGSASSGGAAAGTRSSGKFLPIDLYDASFRGDANTVKRILKTGATFGINRRFESGLFTSLNAACQENHVKIVKLLLKVDSIDVNKPDKFGW